MSSNITFTGLSSGLDTNALVQNLLRFGQQHINELQTTVATDTTQQTAFQGVQSSLQTLQLDASKLGSSQGSVFDGKTVASSNTSIVTAAAGTGAQTGVTSLQVLSLATASQIASQGYADANATISQGTFQVQSGSKSATITIDSTNNTLAGLAQAISNSGTGISATVVNTGSGDSRTQPYRLLLTSTATGSANAIKITNNLGPDSGGAIQPNFATSVIGPAVTNVDFTGTSTVTSGGTYTGSANDNFTFTVATGGTVGTNDGITLNYTNAAGTKTGTLTINAVDVGVAKDVVDGVQVQFAAGSLVAGEKFTLNTFTPTIQAASDAQVQLGSGAGAIVVSNSTNTITNLIQGVTISLQSAAPGQTVQLKVDNDVAGATTAIKNFVSDYNAFVSNLATQTGYTPGGDGTSLGFVGPLNGNTSLTNIATQLQQQILAVNSDLPSLINRLGGVGINPDSNGQLQIDSAALQSALTGGTAGVTFNDVKNLFSLQGQSSSGGITFATGSDKTKASGSTPYTVHITQAATRAAATATNALATTTVIDGTNNTLSLTLDGKSTGTITLNSGTYTAQALANAVQTAINSKSVQNGSSVSVSISGGNLAITSDKYGTASTVGSLSGSALSALGFAGSESGTGTDVAGSYVVNGVTEAATGVGQVLTGNAANTNTSGLVLVVSYTPSQILVGGTDSTLTVTKGLASTLNDTLESLLDPGKGLLAEIGNQYSQSITDAKQEVTDAQAALDAQKTALLQQFAALETTLANLQSTSSLLTSAFASINSSNSSSSSSSSTPRFSSSS